MKQKRKTIVLLHGHGVDDSIWDDVYAYLSEDYTIIKPNFSPLANCVTIEDYADELFRLLDSAAIEKITLVGHSMGGYITLAFAEKYPEMVEGIGLFHSSAYEDTPEKKEQRKKVANLLEKEGSEAFIRLTAPNLFGGHFRKTKNTKYKNYIDRFSTLSAKALAAGALAMGQRPDRTHILKETTVPVLFVLGMKDQLMPFDKIIEQTNLPQRSYHFIVAEAGHMAMVEKPEASAQILRYFFEQIN